MNDSINERSESFSVNEMTEKGFALYLENINSANDSLRAVLIDGFSLSEIETKKLERILYVLIPKIKKSENVIELINLINNEISRRVQAHNFIYTGYFSLGGVVVGALLTSLLGYWLKC